jgi:methyl-accepting chemotaxis protein
MDKALALLARLPIRLRIAALVVLALGGAAAFATVYTYAAHRTDSALAAQVGFSRLNDLAAETQARSLAVQVQAEQFLRERDTRFAAGFHTDAARVAELVMAMRAIPQAAPKGGQLAELAEGARHMTEDFHHLVAEAERLGLREQNGLRGQLRTSVQAIEDELKMWPNAAPLMVDMLHMRQAEKDFMLYGAERLLGNHVRYANQFDFALDGTTLAPSTRTDFRRLLESYSIDMKAFEAGTIALAAEVDRLRARQAAIRPLVEEIFAFAHAGMAQAVAEQEVRAEALAQTSAIGLFGVVAFTLAGLLIALSIVRPLRQIEQVFSPGI